MQAETVTNSLRYSKLIVVQMHFKSQGQKKDNYVQHNSNSLWDNAYPCNETFWTMLLNNQARLF